MNWKKELYVSQSQHFFILWWQNVRETDHLENLGVEKGISFKRIFKKQCWKAWNRIVCMGPIGGLVSTMQGSSSFVKSRAFLWVSSATASFSRRTALLRVSLLIADAFNKIQPNQYHPS
jgi:hypothetical protein